MGVIQQISDALHNPVPESTVDDILRTSAGAKREPVRFGETAASHVYPPLTVDTAKLR